MPLTSVNKNATQYEVKQKCTRCNFRTFNPDVMRKHAARHKEACIVCPFCEVKYSSKLSFRSHLFNHVEEKLKCSICDMEVANSSAYKTHLKLHDPEKCECPKCEFQTPHPHVFREHVSRHGLNDGYQCLLCDFEAADKEKFNIHETIAHEKIDLKCAWKDCYFVAKSVSMLKRHRARMHISLQNYPQLFTKHQGKS